MAPTWNRSPSPPRPPRPPTSTTATTADPLVTEQTREVRDGTGTGTGNGTGSGTLISKTVRLFKEYEWGEEVISKTLDPDGVARTFTWEYYDDPATDGSNLGRIRQITEPSGFWTRYEYDAFGRLVKEVSQFQDSQPSDPENLGRVRETTYPAPGSNVATIVERVLGAEVSRRYIRGYSDGYDTIRCASVGAAVDAPDNLITRDPVRGQWTAHFKGEYLSYQEPRWHPFAL